MDLKLSPKKLLSSTRNLYFEKVQLENAKKELVDEISSTKKLMLNFYREVLLLEYCPF